METKGRKIRSDKKLIRVCDCCLQTFESKVIFTNHFNIKGSKCFRPSEMKRILEDDEEISNYDSSKAHWMKRATTKWNKNKKNPNYLFEDVLDQDDFQSEKDFFNRFSDELDKELR